MRLVVAVRTIAIAGVLVLATKTARAEAAAPLTDDERARLSGGESVLRSQTLEIRGRRYIGGLAYAVVPGRAEDIGALLIDATAMREILPRTQAVLPVARVGNDTLFELHQGNAVVHAQYTLLVRSEPQHNRMRFWLDHTRPHAIDDAWGFFRYEPFETDRGTRVLVTYGILVDLGPGIVRALYEERVRAMALTVPQRLREYVERYGRPAKRA
jgi:hypothetical protein